MKIAIIGASAGYLPLCLKAKEMGLETICFAWDKGAVCKDVTDRFYPVSVLEKEKILAICREEQISAVVTNVAEVTAYTTAYVAESLGLRGNSAECIGRIQDKYQVRQLTNGIQGMGEVNCVRLRDIDSAKIKWPVVVKPSKGYGKVGVSYVESPNDLGEAIRYAGKENDILIERYIGGREFSVESISYEGKHYVIQITDKDSSGPPHFVEIGHHQPADFTPETAARIKSIIPKILDAVSFQNGASHIEVKEDKDGNLYLIEINPRGGGDELANTLVYQSTGYDYLKAMIDVALGRFSAPAKITDIACCGIYYLCAQTVANLEWFVGSDNKPWLLKKEILSTSPGMATGNFDRSGYLIYRSDHKIIPGD